MRHNIVSLKLKYNHGTTEYRGIFSRYLPWSKINGTAQHYNKEEEFAQTEGKDLKRAVLYTTN